MFWPLVLILLAVAAFGVLVVRRRRPATAGSKFDQEQVDGFVYVGSAALIVLSVGVVVLGLLDDRDGRAETVAVLGFGAYGLYLLAAAVISGVSARRR